MISYFFLFIFSISYLFSNINYEKLISSLKNGNKRKLLPSKTSHRSVPAVAERISISTPDQSVTINPCVLQNGTCD